MTEMTALTSPAKPSARWSALWGAGMLAIFFGERMIGAGGARAVATVGGLVLVIAALAVRAGRAAAAAPDRRTVERTLLGLYGLGLLAVVLYFVQSDLPTVLGQGKTRRSSTPGRGWPRRWRRSGRRSGWRPPGRSRSSRWPTRRSRARPRSRWAASATRCTPASAWRRRWCSPSRWPTSPRSATKRSTWPTSAPPAPARCRAGLSATSTSRSRWPSSSPRGARSAKRSTTTCRTWRASRASSRSPTTTSTSTR